MKLLATLILIFLTSWLSAQCPTGLSSQEEVDHFAENYPNCKHPTNLQITGTDIHNLVGLSQLDSCDELAIQSTYLVDLHGLHNLKSIKNLSIAYNVGLYDISDIDHNDYFLDNLFIEDNQHLNACHFLCDKITPYTQVSIHNNGYDCNTQDKLNCLGFIRGTFFYDKNQNKIQDADEPGIPNLLGIKKDNGYWQISNQDGDFSFDGVLEQTYTCKPLLDFDQWVLTTDSASYTFVFDTIDHTHQNLDFGLIPQKKEHRLSAFLFVPGMQNNSILLVKNDGAFTESGWISLQLNSALSVINTEPFFESYDSLTNRFTWRFDSIPPFASKEIVLRHYPSTSDIKYKTTILQEKLGEKQTVFSDRGFISITTTGFSDCAIHSFPYGKTANHLISTDQAITYQLEVSSFNEETYVTDSLDKNLNPATFKLIYSPKSTQIKINPKFFKFQYSSKNLFFAPPIAYQIKPYPETPVGSEINKTIFSQDVFGICTAEAFTYTIISQLRPWTISDNDLVIGPNPTSDFFRLSYNPDYDTPDAKLFIYNALGQIVKEFNASSNKRYFIDDLNPGFYTVVLFTAHAKRKFHSGKLFIQRN